MGLSGKWRIAAQGRALESDEAAERTACAGRPRPRSGGLGMIDGKEGGKRDVYGNPEFFD